MTDPRTVAVGLDVHKSSVRLAAIRAGEVLAERTLAHDHEAVIAALGPWPGARVCQEAGPTGFGLHRALIAAGVDLEVARPRARTMTSAVRHARACAPPRDP